MKKNEYTESIKLIKKLLRLRHYYCGIGPNISSTALLESYSAKERETLINRSKDQENISTKESIRLERECEKLIKDKLEYLLQSGFSKRRIQTSFTFLSSYNKGILELFLNEIESKIEKGER